jgi:signal transduction histidine kinase
VGLGISQVFSCGPAPDAAASRVQTGEAMNVAAAAAGASAGLAAYVALLSRRAASAPGSRDLRPFWVVAFASAVYAVCDLVIANGPATRTVVLASRVQLASAILQIWGWIRFSQAFLDLRPGGAERAASLGLLLAAALSLVPGAAFGGEVTLRSLPRIGAVYHEVEPTRLGIVLMAVAWAATLPVLWRFARARRTGVPHAGTIAAAYSVLVVLGANDALNALRVVDTPYLLQVGFLAPVAATGWMLTGRFIESTRALEKLRADLVADVRARTRALETALDALHQAEKLAAVGQFANGVAHEVNSPASVVMANLRYLADVSRGGTFPADGPEVLGDALQAMQRINDLVRKLVDAGRIATITGAAGAVPVLEVVAKLVADPPVALWAGIELAVKVPERLAVRIRREALEQVLSSLLANATEAIPAGRAGRVEVRAERSVGGVLIAVADDGVGMGPEVLRRALDPFFTTKQAGRGSGLGLAVARGLVEAHGGSLWLESSPGVGTTAFAELPEGSITPAPGMTPAPR